MKIDTKIYLSFLKEMIEQNTDVSIVISGNSMSPFLVNQRDVIYLSKINRKLKNAITTTTGSILKMQILISNLGY